MYTTFRFFQCILSNQIHRCVRNTWHQIFPINYMVHHLVLDLNRLDRVSKDLRPRNSLSFSAIKVPCISESYIEVKIKLIFYFHTSLWWPLKKIFAPPQRSVKIFNFIFFSSSWIGTGRVKMNLSFSMVLYFFLICSWGWILHPIEIYDLGFANVYRLKLDLFSLYPLDDFTLTNILYKRNST